MLLETETRNIETKTRTFETETETETRSFETKTKTETIKNWSRDRETITSLPKVYQMLSFS